MNTFGRLFRFTGFGESHGPAIGGVVDGMPAGVKISVDAIQHQLDRRRPGQSAITTSRAESDRVEILSGIFDGVTTGTPIGFIIRNTDHRSADYSEVEHTFRPSHADYTYTAKYGIRDYRGGGRSSARETATRVVAGAMAMQALASMGISITAFTSAVGPITLPLSPDEINRDAIESNPVRCPDPETARRMEQLILDVKKEGDTIGGVVSCVINGLPAGLGEPVFGRLGAMLASAMMSINAAKGFDYGMGFDGASRRGSEMIDEFFIGSAGDLTTRSNHSGGIQGGISNGQPVTFRVAFKPVATLLRDVATVDDQGRTVTLRARGRHDPCVVPRAVPVVEAMAAMTILDAVLLNRCSRL
ncbi:MAG: chorismate synthase [Duncaniella sp.]|nr:chorismate synthase [Duncaniella sp.]